MSGENLEEEGLQTNPNLELAQWKFFLSLPQNKDNQEVKEKLLQAVAEDNMAPFYETLCTDLGWPLDSALLNQMKEKNKEEVVKMEAEIANAELLKGDVDVREANQKLAEYYCRIGDKEATLKHFQKNLEKAATLGNRLDLTFHMIRVGLFYMDHDLINKHIEKAKTLIEEGGDWDRRNRLKVYEALYYMAIRQFSRAANLFLDTVSTFTSYELMDYQTFVTYAVFVSMIALPRNELREKVVRGSEILEVLHSLPKIKRYLMSLYNCHYAEFFVELADVEQIMKNNRYLAPHYHFYVREMRILAYTQLLESYRSLTLTYMAYSFGVSTDYLDKELARFIAAGRLRCKINRVGGIVETTRPDTNNYHYQTTIKQGDILLNRIQKLSRVINI